ncbi:DNA-binding NarL/FixJ family response regulator [Sphingobium sp. B2D3A]|uniref:response regulator transcription factor n=1 Tax=unclassified Sphingobium TaxID=2611147 RepID=UPI002224463B|nr:MULTISPECIES: response regulator transcription factor [unclassified Sphingobium]MCW2338248.1 DNA-binding NarL/FixJ family response regulator [Sphingobium sp. B2D3A]MCW2384706.1 DNA-binding NarL/FixJ family response regulator [Sphingobium sp. B2D3D]
MAKSDQIRVMVVDDHPLLREGVCAVIETQADLEIVAEAETGEQAIDLYEKHRPDIVLMDLQMPGMGGVAAIEALRKVHPTSRIIVLTTYAGDAQAMRALRAGAVGYLLKSSMRKELLETIRSVNGGGKHLSAEIATGIALHLAEDVLSGRESEVLTLAAAGNSNKQIGVRLGLSEDTVKGYMKVIYSKLGAADRTHAVTIAARRGIIEL